MISKMYDRALIIEADVDDLQVAGGVSAEGRRSGAIQVYGTRLDLSHLSTCCWLRAD